MKLFAVLFATFISLLTIQPTVQLLMASDSSEEVCCDSNCGSGDGCSGNADTPSQNANNCCPGGICNPFEACACCCGGITGKPSLSSVIFFFRIQYHQPTQNEPVLGFPSNCYHPPEFV